METINMNKQIQSIKELFNNIHDTLSCNEINKIRTNIYKKEPIYNFLSKKDKLKSKEERVLNYTIAYFNKLHADLLEQHKSQDDIIYGLDLMFNDDDYYKPVEIKSVFNGSYVLHESDGDKNISLSIPEYFFNVKPYLRDLIDFYNTIGECKV